MLILINEPNLSDGEEYLSYIGDELASIRANLEELIRCEYIVIWERPDTLEAFMPTSAYQYYDKWRYESDGERLYDNESYAKEHGFT